MNHTHENSSKGKHIQGETITQLSCLVINQIHHSSTLILTVTLTLHNSPFLKNTLNNPTQACWNCNPIMEIKFWQRIGEISHAELRKSDPFILELCKNKNSEPLKQVPLSALLHWACEG